MSTRPGRGQYDRTQTKRERRSAQKRAILEAAIPVFATHGWADANVEAVIQKAGVSRRTFYEHFKALDEVLFRIYDNSAEAAIEGVRMAMSAQSSKSARIRAGVRSFLQLVSANPELARVVLREVRAMGPTYERRREALEDRFADMIVHMIEGADPVAALAVVGAVTAVGLRFLEQRRERDLEAISPTIERLAVAALLHAD